MAQDIEIIHQEDTLKSNIMNMVEHAFRSHRPYTFRVQKTDIIIMRIVRIVILFCSHFDAATHVKCQEFNQSLWSKVQLKL